MKGFVFIYGSEVIMRFVATGAFSDLTAKHDLTYVALQSSTQTKEGGIGKSLSSGLQKVEWILFYPERFSRNAELFDISCIRYKDRSSSFQVRSQEQARLEPERMAKLEKLARPETYEKHRAAIEREMGLHPDILALTLRERPDFFVLPSALLDYLTDDVLQVADALSIPTLLLVLGWDNPSSKGLIRHHPTIMGVWGEQSQRHAVEVQGLSPDRVRVVGAPHYEDFHSCPGADRGALRRTMGVPSDGQLVMFAGTFRLFDETALLREMDQAIDTGALPPMHLFYRPHPWRVNRQSEENFFDHDWHHITMDPEIAASYRYAKAGRGAATPDDFSLRMKHLAQIYQAVDAVISPMSTVLLEALLFGLPTMAVAFSDGKHSWSADKVSQMYHFKELYRVPNIIVCRDRADFFPMVQELVAHIGDESFSTALRRSTHEFLYRDGRSYAARVAGLVDDMLTNTPGPAYDRVAVKPGKRYTGRASLLQRAWRKLNRAVRR